jgi:hypothetical protein
VSPNSTIKSLDASIEIFGLKEINTFCQELAATADD